MHFEIIRVVEGCWFDAEGYERTPTASRLSPPTAGYYVFFRGANVPTPARHGDMSRIGPFASEGAAGEAARRRLAADEASDA